MDQDDMDDEDDTDVDMGKTMATPSKERNQRSSALELTMNRRWKDIKGEHNDDTLPLPWYCTSHIAKRVHR
jgi:hypothetical protein